MPDARSLRPMLATQVARPFSRSGWIFEPKLDGVRTLAFVTHDAAGAAHVELRSRRGNRHERAVSGGRRRARRPAGARRGVRWRDSRHEQRGVPSFQDIQPRINLSKPAEVERAAAETPVYFYAFDLLYLDGYDLSRVPLVERKQSCGVR